MDQTIVLLCGVFLGAVVSGVMGFAFSAVAGAILLHSFSPGIAIPLMMICSVAIQLATLTVLRHSIRWSDTLLLMLGGGAGVFVATLLFSGLNAAAIRNAFGAFLVTYALYLIVKRAGVRGPFGGPVSEAAFGFAGGVVGTFTAMPGALPAIWCELRGMPKDRQRVLVQPFILVMQVLALSQLLWRGGGLPFETLRHALVSLPALAAGTWIGLWIYGRIGDRAFRTAVLSLLVLSGLAMIDWGAWLPG